MTTKAIQQDGDLEVSKVGHGQRSSILDAKRMVLEAAPSLLVVGAMLGLIFGGCCSNVGTLNPGVAA